MSTLALFMKGNKKTRTNAFYAATKSLTDKDGKPLKWEIKHVTTEEDERIRDACTTEVPIPGKRNQFRIKIDANAYMTKQIVASVVFPNLYDAELQDSYDVKTPEDLLKQMVDDPVEFAEFASFVREFNGFEEDINDLVDEAKN